METDNNVVDIKSKKSRKNEEAPMPEFRPAYLAVEFEDHLLYFNKSIIYVPDDENWYMYMNGVWRRVQADSVKTDIRQFLLDIEIRWDSTYRLTEVYNNYKYMNSDAELSIHHRKMLTPSLSPSKGYINVKNGMIDINALIHGEDEYLKPHDKHHYSTIQLPVEHDPAAPTPSEFLELLEFWQPDPINRKFLQQYMGYCLTLHTDRDTALIMFGPAGSGKSTFLEIFELLFDDSNINSLSLAQLEEKFGSIQLKNRLINICTDMDPKYLDETSIARKAISGEKINDQAKFKEPEDFNPVAKFIFTCNTIPRMTDKTMGTLRRLQLMEWNQIIPDSMKDSNIVEKFNNDEAKKGILNWALAGLISYYNDGKKWAISESMHHSKSEYISYNDPLEAFIEDACVIDENATIYGAYLYDQYKQWYSENIPSGRHILGKNDFNREMKNKGYIFKPTSIPICKDHNHYRCHICGNGSYNYDYKSAKCFFGIDYVGIL